MKRISLSSYHSLLITVAVLLISMVADAQTADGATGINQANTMLRSYFDPVTNVMYAVGAIAGIGGAFEVFRAFQNRGGHDAGGRAMLWFGSCIFLVVVATVLRSFFGL